MFFPVIFIFMFIFSLEAESKTFNNIKKFEFNDPNNGITLAKCKQKDWIKKKACQAKEAAKKKAEQAAAAKRRAEEEARKRAAEAKRRAEEEARKRAAEAKRRAEEEARRRAAEAKKRAEEEARRRAAEAKKRAEEEARKRAAEAKKKAEQAKKAAAAEAKKKAEQAKKAAAAAKKKAEDQARKAAAASKKAAEDAKRKAAAAAKKAGAGLSAAYLASYKHVTPYVNTTADIAKDLGNDAAKFVKAQFDKWGCFATVGALTAPSTAKALLRKVVPILEKKTNTDLKIALSKLNHQPRLVYSSNLNGYNQFFQSNYYSNYNGLPDYNGLIRASFINPLSTNIMSNSDIVDNGIVLVNKKKKKKKCGKRCQKKKRKAKAAAKKAKKKAKAAAMAAKKKAKEQAKKDRLKKKAQEKKLAKDKKLNKGKSTTAAAGTGAAVVVGSAAAAAGYGKTYKPVKIDTSSPLKLAASTGRIIKANAKGYGQLLSGVSRAAVRIPFIYDQILNADFICNKTGKQQVAVLEKLKLFPKKGIKFASADDNRIFASLDKLKDLSDIDLKSLLISSANAADGGKANDPAEPFFGIELGMGVNASLGVGVGKSIAFNLVTDMDDEVYSFFTISDTQALNLDPTAFVELQACVGPSLKVFGTPPLKVNNFKGLGYSVGFEMAGEVEYFEAASASAGVGVDIGLTSLKSGSQFTQMSIGPVASACTEGPDSDLPVAVALTASTNYSYRLW